MAAKRSAGEEHSLFSCAASNARKPRVRSAGFTAPLPSVVEKHGDDSFTRPAVESRENQVGTLITVEDPCCQRGKLRCPARGTTEIVPPALSEVTKSRRPSWL